MHIAIVVTAELVIAARATVRSVRRAVPTAVPVVLDVDKTYTAVGDEEVLHLEDLELDADELDRAAILLDPEQLTRLLQVHLASRLLRRGSSVVITSPGIVYLLSPERVLDAAGEDGVCLVARTSALPDDGNRPDIAALTEQGTYSTDLIGLTPAASTRTDVWVEVASDWTTGSSWLDLVAGLIPHQTLRDDSVLVSRWNTGAADVIADDDGRLSRDGSAIVAVDLAGLEPSRPWVFDTRDDVKVRTLLSQHPALAELVAREADERLTDPVASTDTPVGALRETANGIRVHEELRALFRDHAKDVVRPPDPFDPDATTELMEWLLEPVPAGHAAPVARYLASIYEHRDDLRAAFPLVPGRHTESLLDWAAQHGRNEDRYAAVLVDQAVSASRRASTETRTTVSDDPRRGVNVVGYLSGELGVGESARLMADALSAARVPYVTIPVVNHLQSRTGATYRASTSTEIMGTTLLCVNADQTPEIVAALGDLAEKTYRIGMWYWEVEEFPASQHAAFSAVDEVWVATDFIRDAISAHAPVPVLTIPPPLPQRGARSDGSGHRLGLPEGRPVFLFAFDYLSTAERKNPWGAVAAFRMAFERDEGPILVIKSINGDRRQQDAERLRLLVADEPDVFLLEDYLSADDRDALVASCACYVSLHRAEGLGLTLAEAMAWGKPVIATAYSGNMQFMTDENSFLVPWTPVPIPAGNDPYPAGSVWADPDLAVAARHMRTVVESPSIAAAKGEAAARDVARKHSPAVAARLIVQRLAELSSDAAAGSRRPRADNAWRQVKQRLPLIRRR